MKRTVLFVLALVAAAIANEQAAIKDLADKFETDVPTVEACFKDAETNMREIHAAQHKWLEMKSEEDIDEEAKEALMKHGRFLACMLEKQDMMVDSKLVLSKILESMDSEKVKYKTSKEDVEECVNALNEDNDLTKADRALGLLLCFISDEAEKVSKK